MAGHNVGICLERARSARVGSARASAGDRAVAAQGGWHRYAVSWDHRPFINAGGRHPQPVGVGVGKRRWYATIFSFDRPRSRSVSAERRGRSLSRVGFTPCSSARPWPLPRHSLVFTHVSFRVHPDRWQKASGYNMRAKVEAAISRYKRVIGDILKSRDDPRRVTEVAIAVKSLNRMRDLGQAIYVRVA